ncbi:hypothetical protein [Gordonia sp. NPDC003376]
MASTILTAALPDRMAVYDRHAAKALATLGFEHPGQSYSAYMAAVCDVAQRLSEHTQREWCPRDVDKALFVGRSHHDVIEECELSDVLSVVALLRLDGTRLQGRGYPASSDICNSTSRAGGDQRIRRKIAAMPGM